MPGKALSTQLRAPLSAEAGAGIACCHSPLPLFHLGAVLILEAKAQKIPELPGLLP